MAKIEVQDWGLIDYNEAWGRQKELVREIQKKRNRNVLVFCEHPTVITLGKNGHESNILIKTDFLEKIGVRIVKNDRGGDVTLHNPGQLVGYPIFNLLEMKQDLHWFLREIESAIIDTLGSFGIKSAMVDGLTGVWVENRRKVCAMGFHCSRWVTSHGFALNVNNNLHEFDYIVPCGIDNKEVTSISRETGIEVDLNYLKKVCSEFFINRFR